MNSVDFTGLIICLMMLGLLLGGFFIMKHSEKEIDRKYGTR